MLALGPRSFGQKVLQHNPTIIRHIRRGSERSTTGNEDLEADYSKARKWISNFGKSSLPTNIAKVRYDRSSGKGGQHVNKTNSKATVTWPMHSILSYIPEILHSKLRSSRYYVVSSDSLQIAAQSSRSQRDNEDECHQKLYNLLQDISKQVIRGETSPEQRAKVKRLQKAENEGRLKMKKSHSAKKQSRGNGGGVD